jgi:hypothetical protein
MDGGVGRLRALLAACALAPLEAALLHASGEPGAHVADYFDLTASTSTGSVFAATFFSTHSRGEPLFYDALRLFRPPAGSSSLFHRGKEAAASGAGGLHEGDVQGGAHPA